MSIIKRLLEHPLTTGLSVDDPLTTQLRIEVIKSKPFLRSIYYEWYESIIASLPERQNNLLELGSGAGSLKELLPNIITSEVFQTPGVDLIADARNLPLTNESLDAIVMTDVFHHIPNVSQFLSEAVRCIRPGGKILMVEPWFTPWSHWVYTHLHPEPFITTGGWEIPQSGPLSGANGALPWIVFMRDRERFELENPQLKIKVIKPIMPIAYLFSGGISMRSLMPAWAYKATRALESALWQEKWAMFAFIELERVA
jgi:SAM-dependent methyltransferase